MTSTITLLLMALLLGLGGSLHCLAMCGPLVLRMPFSAGKNSIGQTILYHLGKSTAYGLLGIVFGIIGRGFVLFNWQQILSVVAGLVMVGLALLPGMSKKLAGSYVFSKQLGGLLAGMRAAPAWYHFLAIGFLNGFLPCGLVYTALAGATVTAHPGFGFLFMFIFGMGTVPALSVLAFVNSSLQISFRRRLKNVSVVFSLLVGALLILRGLNLNIPYISPHQGVHSHTIECGH